MIDYEKIKKAHELADKYIKSTKEEITIVHTFWGDNSKAYQLFIGEVDCYSESFDNLDIDDLITKLEELTRPTPKYDYGEVVWYEDEGLINNFIITGIDKRISDNMFCYSSINMIYVQENHLYKSRKELIEAKINFWTKKLGALYSIEQN